MTNPKNVQKETPGAAVCCSSGGNVAEFKNNTFYVYKDSYLYFQPNPQAK